MWFCNYITWIYINIFRFCDLVLLFYKWITSYGYVNIFCGFIIQLSLCGFTITLRNFAAN